MLVAVVHERDLVSVGRKEGGPVTEGLAAPQTAGLKLTTTFQIAHLLQCERAHVHLSHLWRRGPDLWGPSLRREASK
jgi:hypothetical protein